MDSSKFISQLNGIHKLGSEAFPHLVELTEKYPWFAAAHILQAKCLHNQNKYGFTQALKKASIYSGNREVLYDVIHQFQAPLSPIIAEKEHVKKVEIKPKVEVDNVTIKDDAVEALEVKPADIQSPVAGTFDNVPPLNIQKKSEAVDIEASNVEKITTEADLSIQEEPKLFETDKPDKIESEAVIVPLTKDPIYSEKEKKSVPKLPRKPLIDLPSRDEIQIRPKVTQPLSKPLVSVIYDPEKELQKLVHTNDLEHLTPSENLDPKPEKHDFLSWLNTVNEPMAEKVEKQPRRLPMSEESKKLLENFIKNRPSVSRNQPMFTKSFGSENLNQSTEEELVSESLAILFLKQSLPEKAIEVYRKLQLQNPQKFSYFAALIKSVEKDL